MDQQTRGSRPCNNKITKSQANGSALILKTVKTFFFSFFPFFLFFALVFSLLGLLTPTGRISPRLIENPHLCEGASHLYDGGSLEIDSCRIIADTTLKACI